VVVAAALAGLAAGLALMAVLDEEAAPAAAAAPEVVHELQVLNREMAALRADLGRQVQASPGDGEAQPADPVPLTASVDVERLLQELATVLAEVARHAGASPVAPQADPARRQRLHTLLVETLRGSRDRPSHLLWSVPQLLDAYGPPSSVHVNEDEGTVSWVFQFGDDGSAWFKVHDGLVISEWFRD